MFTFKKALPEEVGIPSSSIKELLLFLDKKDIPMHSMLIMRQDKLVLEKYYAPYAQDTLHRMFSISKSFTALAIFLLLEEKKITLDDSITDYFPEYVNADTHPWIKATTIKNMLMMRTCHAAATYKADMTSDWTKSFFTTLPTHKPGTVFHYDTSAAHVLCALVEKLTGKPMLDYLKEKILNYMDFSKESYMIKDPFGVSIGGSGLMATPMDVLKVLFLLDKKGTITCNDGIVRTLLNPELIEKATSNLSDTIMTGPLPSEASGYGMQIWQNEMGGYVLYGMGGQLAISLPEKELLIMTTADTQGIAGGNQVIYDAIYNILLPSIKNAPLNTIMDEKKSAYDSLVEVANFLEIAPPRMPKSRLVNPILEDLPEFIKGVANPKGANIDSADSLRDNSGNFSVLKYDLDENAQGFSSLQLNLSHNGVSTLRLIRNDEKSTSPLQYDINFGIQNMQEGIFPKYGTHYTAGAIWLRENTLYIRVHLIGECVGSVRFELFFEEKEITVFMRKIEETYFKEFDGHLHGYLQCN
ncbi:serine hydrolase domain-containing protein [Butyrivibrio sp. YAB3001]|uniref:serine hydrolase domain-containing protein n=1 Tax=Butyrivibrio sp. YAB3001 TaxID=1520812 RepID=UPI0008F62263|nr:serine hydrolase domain-containing protein [Butyrivibrio sp. YAB3001]SFC44480.1 CubicO group peptidase, beta-lactamase class C family [Butyrivibrio sp. YAB3001]